MDHEIFGGIMTRIIWPRRCGHCCHAGCVTAKLSVSCWP